MVVIALHYSSSTFHLNVLLNGCVLLLGLRQMNLCFMLGYQYLQKRNYNLVLCIRSVLYHDCVPEFIFTLIKYTY